MSDGSRLTLSPKYRPRSIRSAWRCALFASRHDDSGRSRALPAVARRRHSRELPPALLHFQRVAGRQLVVRTARPRHELALARFSPLGAPESDACAQIAELSTESASQTPQSSESRLAVAARADSCAHSRSVHPFCRTAHVFSSRPRGCHGFRLLHVTEAWRGRVTRALAIPSRCGNAFAAFSAVRTPGPPPAVRRRWRRASRSCTSSASCG